MPCEFLETTYTYSDLGQLLMENVTRVGVTRTRTWAYDAVKREGVTPVTHPESGETSATHNNDGTVAEKTDAETQKLVKRLLAGDGENVCQRAWYCYDTQAFAAGFRQNTNGRLAAVGMGRVGAGLGGLLPPMPLVGQPR